MQTPEFLETSDVLTIHQILVEQFGGMLGVRDEGLLESALSQPKATFFGELLHPTIHEQAAAYLFHIAKNHPFIDGNKRTAYGATEAFLRLNRYNLTLTNDEAYDLVMRVAQGQMGKEEIAVFLQKHLKER